MNLFGSQQQKPATPPSIDEARQRVEDLRKQRGGLRNAAHGMLVAGNNQPKTAKRDVTGN